MTSDINQTYIDFKTFFFQEIILASSANHHLKEKNSNAEFKLAKSFIIHNAWKMGCGLKPNSSMDKWYALVNIKHLQLRMKSSICSNVSTVSNVAFYVTNQFFNRQVIGPAGKYRTFVIKTSDVQFFPHSITNRVVLNSILKTLSYNLDL